MYFIEFSQWNSEGPLRWQLFRRQFFMSKEEIDRIKAQGQERDFSMAIMTREWHPFSLGEGIVNENPNVIAMDTKAFLMHMVDALNEKAKRDDTYKPIVEKAMDRIYGDNTYKMTPTQTDGGRMILVNETELPDYPRDGKKSA